jgi:hypothetical protein
MASIITVIKHSVMENKNRRIRAEMIEDKMRETAPRKHQERRQKKEHRELL